MPISGKIYIVPKKETETWEVWVQNTGDKLIGVTQNVLPPEAPELNAHDDHTYASHGLLAGPNGGVSQMSFHKGDTYTHQGYNGPHASHPITEKCLLRLGLRGVCDKTIPLPPLDGPPVELDLQDFHWYGGTPQTANPQTGNMQGYMQNTKRGVSANVANGGSIISQIQALMTQAKSGLIVKGRATVTAVPTPAGILSHWEVKLENLGAQSWIGTVAFSGAAGGKRAGAGLESMPCPDEGSAAVQRIESNGNYGVIAAPGAKLRLGVRGYGWAEVDLPAAGAVEVPFEKLTVEASQKSDQFFDREQVLAKRAEKLDKVQFFDKGVAINAEIKPIAYKGDEAKARADFDPPHVVVRGVPHSDETPGGGWVIEAESKLPAKDDHGDLGFVATLKLGEAGWDPAQVPPKKLEAPGEKKSWFLPKDANLNGVVAAPGCVLSFGTRGLGWYAQIPLPPEGATVDATSQLDLWSYRDDQFDRDKLARDFTQKCRN